MLSEDYDVKGGRVVARVKDEQVGMWKGFEIHWDGSYLYAVTPNAGYKPIPKEYWVASSNGKRDMLVGSNGRQIKVNIEKYIDVLKGW